MAITTNIDKMTRTARDMTEAQRDSYETFAESFTASQRRGARLAQDGLKFFKLQEDNARATQEWFANGVRLMQLQQRNASFVQDWLGGSVEALREQADHNRRAADAFARSARKQQEGLRTLGQEWVGVYRNFFSSFDYAREGLRTAQQATRHGLEAATQQVAQQGLRVAEETAEQTEKVLRETEEATREAELRTAVHGALKVESYEELNVEETSKRLDGLSDGQLKQVREYEKRNKNRETLLDQIDRKIKAAS